MKAVTISSLRARMKYYFDLVSKSMDVIIIPRNNNWTPPKKKPVNARTVSVE